MSSTLEFFMKCHYSIMKASKISKRERRKKIPGDVMELKFSIMDAKVDKKTTRVMKELSAGDHK